MQEPGNHFLAGAGFPQDQDIKGRIGYNGNQLMDFLYQRVVSNKYMLHHEVKFTHMMFFVNYKGELKSQGS